MTLPSMRWKCFGENAEKRKNIPASLHENAVRRDVFHF